MDRIVRQPSPQVAADSSAQSKNNIAKVFMTNRCLTKGNNKVNGERLLLREDLGVGSE